MNQDMMIADGLRKLCLMTGKKFDPDLLEIWVEVLGPMDPAAIEWALESLRKTWRYRSLPLPAEVLDEALDYPRPAGLHQGPPPLSREENQVACRKIIEMLKTKERGARS